MAKANTLAYNNMQAITVAMRLMVQAPLIVIIISQNVCHCYYFHPSLIFVRKTTKVEPHMSLHSNCRLLALHTLGKGEWQRQTL
jgi:hypothetical protein